MTPIRIDTFERHRFAFTTLVQPNLDFLHYDHVFAASNS
jgi:hypothetical protein